MYKDFNASIFCDCLPVSVDADNFSAVTIRSAILFVLSGANSIPPEPNPLGYLTALPNSVNA